jgi:pimeloyl-ACP methyl ester carboxylesterase
MFVKFETPLLRGRFNHSTQPWLSHGATTVLLLAAGCARLAPGTVDAPANPARVCLIRGYLDWYSTGIDQLAGELRSAGVPANAFREEQWGDLADAIIRHPPHPTVLIGFSYGADDVILIARRMNDHHLPVDLLITIDPVTPATVPPNVKRCVSFYEPNGFWDIFPWLRGVPLTADPGGHAENINIRTHPDLDEPGTSHSTIAANEKVHQAIVRIVIGKKYQ